MKEAEAGTGKVLFVKVVKVAERLVRVGTHAVVTYVSTTKGYAVSVKVTLEELIVNPAAVEKVKFVTSMNEFVVRGMIKITLFGPVEL